MIAAHFKDHLDGFDNLIKVTWKERPTPSQLAGRPDPKEDARVIQGNNQQAHQVRESIRRFMDGLIQLCEIPEVPAIPRAASNESDLIFSEIQELIGKSRLPPEFRTVVSADVTEAQKCYRGQSYKSCVVMLGAALEGLMVGTLQRTDVLAHCVKSPPKAIAKLGTGNPTLANKIGTELGFEDYKNCIHDLIPGSSSLGVDNIQSFRNAIHPWKSIKEPLKYGSFDHSSALHYIASFKKIVEALYNWSP